MTPNNPTKPQKYRSKPYEIEAAQYDGTNLTELIEWSDGKVCDAPNPNVDCYVETPQGKMAFAQGEFIIKTEDGEFFPCTEANFNHIYELAELAYER